MTILGFLLGGNACEAPVPLTVTVDLSIAEAEAGPTDGSERDLSAIDQILLSDGTGGPDLFAPPCEGIACGPFRFAAPSRYPIPTFPASANAMAAGDVDGDGRLDLVTGNSESFSLLIGLGGGQFAAATSNPDFHEGSVALADLNADGKADLAIGATRSNSGGVYLSRGNSFGPIAQQFFEGQSTGFPAVADFNGDGRPDLAFAEPRNVLHTYRGHVWVHLNQGQGKFSAPVLTLTAAKSDTGPLVVRDFDGDGRLDIAAINSGHFFGDEAVDVTYLDAKPAALGLSRRPLGKSPRSIDAGDVNGDGRLDLVFSVDEDRRLTILLNQGGRDQWTKVDYALPERSWCSRLGDLDRDGRLDVVVGLENGLALFQNLGGGALALRQLVPVGIVPSSVVLQDFDGDKRLDIAVDYTATRDVNGRSMVAIFLNRTP